MFRHIDYLQFEAKPEKPDPVYAHKLQELIGGAYGEMTVTMQYLFQGWSCRMPGKCKDLIMDVATLAALALADALRAEQMRAAVVNRDLIGQAKGILMERHRITADAAFALLAEASQHKNVKLTEVAACLVETGELIGSPGPGQ